METPPLPNQDGNARTCGNPLRALSAHGNGGNPGYFRPGDPSRTVAWFPWCGKFETQVRGCAPAGSVVAGKEANARIGARVNEGDARRATRRDRQSARLPREPVLTGPQHAALRSPRAGQRGAEGASSWPQAPSGPASVLVVLLGQRPQGAADSPTASRRCGSRLLPNASIAPIWRATARTPTVRKTTARGAFRQSGRRDLEPRGLLLPKERRRLRPRSAQFATHGDGRDCPSGGGRVS